MNRSRKVAAVVSLLLLAGSFVRSRVQDPDAVPQERSHPVAGDYDPTETARRSIGKVVNVEAGVAAQCYTKTAGVSNPCWTCHTMGTDPNVQEDWRLQDEYSFSDFALTNRWSNLFRDRRPQMRQIADNDVLAWVRTDNYRALRTNLAKRADYPGYVPDLDFDRGFDDCGFAKDGSGWRALRYKPFPGTFWPTNGSTDDVFIRLPVAFRSRSDGAYDSAIYRANLSILEASIAAVPAGDGSRRFTGREVEPLDERLLGIDLDGDGKRQDGVRRIVHLPSRYVGAANGVKVVPRLYPAGTEFLHTVRYLDPDDPRLLSRRIKEVRYSVKRFELDRWKVVHAYDEELEAKEGGVLPQYSGSPLTGLMNEFGWQLQAFIEDSQGRLRLQTEEEHRSCMGCHSALSVTVDQTFTLPRKVPGAAGWRWQDPRGIQDVPQSGHSKPEILTYFERVLGGDEFRANQEVIDRFFENGRPKEAEVRRAAKGGDRDITWLIAPSRRRALELNKSYMVIVREQSFHLGKDALLAPPENVHAKIENGETELGKADRLFLDGRIWLDW